MSEWQHAHKTVLGRDTYILDNEMYTDVTFSMTGEREGEQQLVEVKCHRVYLAKSSPVFSAMFYGDLKKFDQEEVIFLPDVTEHSFKAMLTYMYTGEVELSKYKYEVVCGLLYLSKKYLLHKSLLDQLYSHLWHHMYPGNVWTALHFAETNDEPLLEETAWKAIDLKTSQCLQLKNFQEAKVTWLQKLVAKDNLRCREVELFNALLRWSDSEAGRQGVDPSPMELRNILAPVLANIRFLAMTGPEFVSIVMSSGVLTHAEMCPLITNLNVPDFQTHPENLCTSKIQRNVKTDVKDFFVFASPKSEITDYANLIKMTPSVFGLADVHLLSKVDRIASITLPTQIAVTNKAEEYQENLTVVFFNSDKVLLTESFSSVVKYNSVHTFFFSSTLVPCYCCYSHQLRVCILFHTSGRYPHQNYLCRDGY